MGFAKEMGGGGGGGDLVRIKELFFDRAAVTSAVDRATRNVLSKFGAFVRRTAKGLIRHRKTASRPGQSPSSHTGLLREFILFHYEPDVQTVVIGPAKLNGKNSNAPEVLEKGGVAVISYGKNKGKAMRVEKRPYMGPAYQVEEPKLETMWANSVK